MVQVQANADTGGFTFPKGLSVRQATTADTPAIVALLADSMGWAGDERDRRFFEWKHGANPFGPSPMWVVSADEGDDEQIVAVRTFLRWDLHDGQGVRRCARAVDTATHPSQQGKGLFRTLTAWGLDQLRDDGIDFVFNTPNEKSRPGYLKLGWRELGRPHLTAHVRSPAHIAQLRKARTAADKWSTDTPAGFPVDELLQDHETLDALVQRAGASDRLATHRTPDYFTWRYGFEDLKYRAYRVGDGVDAGVIIFRARRRGELLELAVCDLLGVPHDAASRAIGELLEEASADYALTVGALTVGALTVGAPTVGAPTVGAPTVGALTVGSGALTDWSWRQLPLPIGPKVVARTVTTAPPRALREFGFTLGDVELF